MRDAQVVVDSVVQNRSLTETLTPSRLPPATSLPSTRARPDAESRFSDGLVRI